MALDYNGIASALNLKLEDDIASQINRATVALNLLPIKKADGKNVAWDARFGTQVGAARSDGATAGGGAYNVDVKVPVQLPFCTYDDAFQVYGRAMAAAALAGPEALMNLFEEEALNSVERLAQGINADLYTGTGGSSPEVIEGLMVHALLATGLYGGVDRATYPQWASNILANSGVKRDLSIQLMRDLRKAIYIASGKKPDLWLMDPNQHERLGNLLNEKRRFVDQVNMRGEVIKLDGGYNVIEFDGTPCIEDKDAPDGAVIALHTPSVNIVVLPDPMESLMGGSAGEVDVGGTDEEQFGAMKRLRARIQPLAVNGDVRNLQTLLYLQLQVKHPNRCGALKDLNT